jgi:hypothetical protein
LNPTTKHGRLRSNVLEVNAITWIEEHTYDAASGIPLRIALVLDGKESELRRAVNFSLK